MTLPPERITVKRRRDEDPVDALLMRPRKSRPSTVWKLAGSGKEKAAYADSVVSSEPHRVLEPASSDLPKVPLVKPGRLYEDVPKETIDVACKPDVPLPPGKPSSLSSITRPIRGSPKLQEFTSEHRSFHLAKSSFVQSSPYAVSKTPAQKHSRIRQNELAVFVETGKASRARSIYRTQVLTNGATFPNVHGNVTNLGVPEKPRKRPNASAAERKWRAENWGRRTEQRTKQAEDANQSSHESDCASPELTAYLQHIALEETKFQEEHQNDIGSCRKLKTQPKPPRPRQPLVQSLTGNGDEDEIMADIVTSDDDSEYVFDTYIRSNAQPPGMRDAADPFLDTLQSQEPSSLGLIIIEDGEEEELWETFVEDFDSEPDFNSEEEDENAEDFYGNDYPEDEVNSDDEFGRGAYNYRLGASDDEEFDDEEPNWSEDEK